MTWHSLFSADPFGWTILDLAAKATVLIVLAAGLSLLFVRSSAALRHRTWAMLFIALLLLPVLGPALPGWDWQIIPRRWRFTTPTAQQALPNPSAAPSRPVTPSGSVASATATDAPLPPTAEGGSEGQPIPSAIASHEGAVAASGQAHISERDATSVVVPARPPVHWLALAWLSGAFLTLVPLAVGILANIRLRWRSPILSGSEWQGLLDRLSRQVGLRCKVRLLSAGPRQMPMTFGVWRPCVVLPADASDWSPERREIVLLHELAHVARNDVPLQMIARLACAVYWFHPLAWWALRRMRVEREYACDDYVLRVGQKASDYASQLLEIARAHACRSGLLNAALSMARPSQLEGRLLAVLDENRSRMPLSPTWGRGLAAMTVALVIALATVRPALQADTHALGKNSVSTVPSAAPENSSNPIVVTGDVSSPEGKPVAGARIEAVVFARERKYAWDQIPSQDEPTEYEYQETKSDASGKFRFTLSRNVSQPTPAITILASADRYCPATHSFFRAHTVHNVKLKLHEPKLQRVRFIDAAGAPVGAVDSRIGSAILEGNKVWFVEASLKNSSAWPRCAPSGKDGYTTLAVPASAKQILLPVHDHRFASKVLFIQAGEKPVSAMLTKPRFIIGKVTAEDSGKPIPGAQAALCNFTTGWARADSPGAFRIEWGKNTVENYFLKNGRIVVKPPLGSAYLPRIVEWAWPEDGFSNAEVSATLKRGVVVDGRVVENASGKGVRDAHVFFVTQEDNPYLKQLDLGFYRGYDMQYPTDAEGRFRIPVLPGPGYLLVQGPSLDYVHAPFSYGQQRSGKPGLRRQYPDAVARLNLKPDDPPQSLTIPLQRGVTLRRRVVCPDGRPASGTAIARSYVEFVVSIGETNPMISTLAIDDGLLQLPGFEPEQTNPIFIADREHRCGAVVSPGSSEVDFTSPAIRLQPCGTARLRFVRSSGKPLTGYRVSLRLLVTPGEPGVAGGALRSDFVHWENFSFRFGSRLKADSDGRLTVDVIPGATYQVEVSDGRKVSIAREFSVRPGETTDVGDVVVPQRN